MSYRPRAVAAVVTALSVMHITNGAAQSVYVAPGGVYIGAGAGPVYVSPAVPPNGAAAYVDPGYGYGYGSAAYVDPGYGYGYGAAAYVDPGYDYGYGTAAYVGPAYGYGYVRAAYSGCNCGYGTATYVDPGYGYYGFRGGAYVAPSYGYGYGARPYIAPRYGGYGYGVVPHRRYYSGPRSAYAAGLPPRPPLGVPYRRAIRR
jgi:hypothetical protein